MKPSSFKKKELTAEFGTKLVNFLRQLHKVNFTSTYSSLVQKGKVILAHLKIFISSKTIKNPHAEDIFDYAIAMLRHSVSEYWL